MKYLHTLFLALALCLTGCSQEDASPEKLTRFVDPKIGSGGHGHVFVGANVPFGLVQAGPTSIPQDWDWCSGYHESDSTVIGFSHTHLSGTGIGDLFDITVMPTTGKEFTYARGREDDPQSGLWSYADRTREIGKPGYYSVPLTRYGITVEMTATSHVGFHRYTYPEAADAGIAFDLQNGGCWDRTTETFIEVADPATGEAAADQTRGTALRGYRYSRGWADDQKIYFYAELSKPFTSIEIMPQHAHVFFHTGNGEQVLMKVALSSVGMHGAYENMQSTCQGWAFDQKVKLADEQWNYELSKIRIHTDDEQLKKIFYTALYHTMIAPNEFSDVGGTHRHDHYISETDGHTIYTTFSLWDTYRAAMPLYSIFQQDRYEDFISSMLHIYQEQGKLPVWHLHGCETNCMVGNPGIMPVADAVVNGYDGDYLFQAMKASAMRPDRGQDLRMKYGYIPCDLFNESVAYDLEYAIADAAIANAAKHLSELYSNPEYFFADKAKAEEYQKEYEYFHQRSKSYRHLFDNETGFIRGKDSKGEFRKEYNPFYSSHRADDYCEGNGWQYTWLVPHDVEGLIECFGSKEAFISKLDSLFIVPSVIEGEESSPDISGLIGQYAHGNEPSHHILYLYTMAGEPWKAADRIREVLGTLYTAEPDGLAGNEDVGQMSAWYIMSSMGFYQVEPGSGRYWFGTPLFEEITIDVARSSWGEKDKKFTIKIQGNSDKNRYIQSITLNGKPHSKGYIEHKDIIAGGELILTMGQEPALWY